jgi:hypothetical protein
MIKLQLFYPKETVLLPTEPFFYQRTDGEPQRLVLGRPNTMQPCRWPEAVYCVWFRFGTTMPSVCLECSPLLILGTEDSLVIQVLRNVVIIIALMNTVRERTSG